MPSISTDRLSGLGAGLAIKAPCKAVSTAALTLSGEQTVGGVACVEGDRVLLAIAGGSINNGIWVCSTGSWTRAKDFDGNRDVVGGTMIVVKSSSSPSVFYEVLTQGAITIGTTSISIEISQIGAVNAVGHQTFTATAGEQTFTLTNFSYATGVNSLWVTVDGFEVDATEVSSTSFSTPEPLLAGQEVRAWGGRYLTTGMSASNVSYLSSRSGSVSRSQEEVNDDILTSRTLGISSSKSASYNKGALVEAMSSDAGQFKFVTDLAGEVILIDGVVEVPENMEIIGGGRWGTAVCSTDLDAPVFRVVGDNVSLRGLHLSYQGTPLAGANAIEATNVNWLDLYRMWISSAWNAIYLNGGGDHEIVGLRCYSYEDAGLLVDGAIDVNLTNFRMSAMARPGTLGGIRLYGGVEAFTASQGDITLGAYGLTCDTNGSGARGTAPYFNRFSQVFFDSPLYSPAYLRYAQHLDFVACWFASAGHAPADTGYTSLTDVPGIDMEHCQHVTFDGGECYGNGGNGVNHYANNKYIAYKGMRFKRNGRYRSSSRAGINVIAGATDFSVSGGLFELDADTTNYKQDVAVSVNTGASDRYVIADNLLGGTSVSDGGSGSNKRVENNY